MLKFKLFLSIILFLNCLQVKSQTIKILFDATKAETAGNADWTIDADLHNLGFGSGPAVIGKGNEANPQQFPTPDQSTVTASTIETYWNGGLSAWGIDCVKKGYEVETLPYNGLITFGDASNAQDLSNYKVFIICEPNIVFTSSEKSALINFVNSGGGLFIVSDHDGSDRNNDNWDSPQIWNDFMSNNSIANDPFGFSFDYDDFSQTSSNISASANDSIIHGVMGNVSQVQWSDGTSMTLNPADNTSIKGVIYKTGSPAGNTGAMCAYARYGQGKVAAIGDSSPCDDGTGDGKDQLFNGYTQDANGNHRTLLMNITIWLAGENSVATTVNNIPSSQPVISIYPNPTNNFINIKWPNPMKETSKVILFNTLGQAMGEKDIMPSDNLNETFFDIKELPAGVYFLSVYSSKARETFKVEKF